MHVIGVKDREHYITVIVFVAERIPFAQPVEPFFALDVKQSR